MGTRGLEIVRFRGRYYVRYQFDSYFEGLGAKIIASIPSDPKGYHEWLESMRAKYAAKESALEKHVYEIRDGFEPDYSQFREFETLLSELPRLNDYAEYFYIINLDHEDELWLHAIADSIYPYKSTISLDICPEEYIISPDLEFPNDFRLVAPRTDIAEAPKAFLTHILAGILIQYKEEIIKFGMEWSSDSLPFRELTFALVLIASGQAKFHSFSARESWAGDNAPLLEFCSPSHRPDEPPGASPTETIYWLDDVLVSLALVVDGDSVTKAVTWGIEQGRTNFQIVILSLFEVAFAEVCFNAEVGPLIKVSGVVNLSPLRADYCVSTLPRQRPKLKPGMEAHHPRGELIMNSNCTRTIPRLRSQCPGLAALVNFFEVATSRRAASTSAGILPLEMYDRIVNFVDYDTWKTFLQVSAGIRSCCLRKYMLDDRVRIVAGPFVRLQGYHKQRLLSFNFENIQTGSILPMMHVPYCTRTKEHNWMPVIGRDRKAIMLDMGIQFEPGGDVPVETDSDDECA